MEHPKYCQHHRAKVIDSRDKRNAGFPGVLDGSGITRWRRYECLQCGHRFNTVEMKQDDFKEIVSSVRVTNHHTMIGVRL